MTITEQDLINLREQIQGDLMCVLNRVDIDTVDRACGAVVDRINNLIWDNE